MLLGGPHAISEETYRADPGVNISSLKHFKDTPSKARRRIDRPRQTSPAQALGTAIHMAILERDRFLDSYAVKPDVDARTKAGKEALAAARESGKELLDKDEYEAALALSVKLREQPFFRQFIEGGEYETSWFSRHEYGARLKGRLDIWLPARNIIVDIKTCESADEYQFGRDAWKYSYHAQAAYYCDLVASVTKTKVDGYVILAVEKTEDRDCRAFWIDNDLLENGRSLYRDWLAKWVACEQTGTWPGYDKSLVTLSAPRWAQDQSF